jgi:uncharacterized membrane protein
MTQDLTGAQAPTETTGRTAFQWLGILGPVAALIVAIVFLSNTNWTLVFKTLHVLAAIVWLGGGAAITLLALRAQRTKDTMQLLQIGKQAEYLGMRVFTPASLVVLVFGIVLMAKEDVGYGEFWSLFGLIAWAVSFLIGAAFLGPEAGRLARLMETNGPDDAVVQARLGRIISVARADVCLILLVALDMVAKPFLS